MVCTKCMSEMTEEKRVYTEVLEGVNLVILDVPTLECGDCLEQRYSAIVYKSINRLAVLFKNEPKIFEGKTTSILKYRVLDGNS